MPTIFVQCNELGNCIKCKSDCTIIEYKENGVSKRACELNSELNEGYYQIGGSSLYYKCINGCKHCDNDSVCNECK